MMRAPYILLGLLLLLAVGANGQSVSFSRQEVEPLIEGSPLAAAAADVDRDNRLDIVVADTDLDSVTVLFGNGDGTFVEPGATYSLDPAAGPRSIVLADFNNDTYADIITANEVTNSVAVMMNRGDGTFDAPVETSVGVSPSAVATGDVNKDGKVDAVSADGYDDTITVLLGDGSGQLAAQAPVAVGSGPSDVALGDLDGDSKVDLVVTNSTSGDDSVGSITILKGAGDGTFTAQPEISSDALDTPVWVDVADFNHDSKPDIVVLNQELDDVAVFLGNGDLTFQAPLSAPVSSVPNSCVVADYDGDGNMDIACTGEFEDKVAVLIGLGDGTFAPLAEFDVGVAPYGVLSADFNRDQKADLVTTNQDSENLTILLNTTSSGIACVGDCDGSGEVTVDELVRMVNIALGALPPSECMAGDGNQDGEVTIDEIISGVNSALNGCVQ